MGAVSCCVEQTDGAPGGGSASQAERELEVDFSAQGSRVLATGPEVMTTTGGDAITFQALAVANETLELVAGLGLRWTVGAIASGTSFTSTTRTAANIQAELGQFYAILDSDATWRYRLEAYYSSIEFVGAEYLFCGLSGATGVPNNAATRVNGGGPARQAATRLWRPAIQTTGVNYTSPPGATIDVSGVQLAGNSLQAYGGVWAGSWADTRFPATWGIGKLADVALTAPMADQNVSLALAFASQTVAADGCVVVCERMRVRASP